MGEVTNKQRAEWAQEALAAYPPSKGEDLATRAADLVCDLLHLLRREAGMDTDEEREDWLMGRLLCNRAEIAEDEEG